MKQAARMQQQMEQTQAALASRTVEATSGGGAVKVIVKCDGTNPYFGTVSVRKPSGLLFLAVSVPCAASAGAREAAAISAASPSSEARRGIV